MFNLELIGWCVNNVLTQVIDRDDTVLFYLWSVIFELDRDQAVDTEENDQKIEDMLKDEIEKIEERLGGEL
jgi:DNA-directed RNA polymerase subunit L